MEEEVKEEDEVCSLFLRYDAAFYWAAMRPLRETLAKTQR